MKTNHIKFLSGLAVACAAWPLLADPTVSGNRPEDFPHAVQFELGASEFAPGDSITIQELRGTADDIRPGETYCVTGTYRLNSELEADLSWSVTTTNRISTPTDARQTVHIVKGTGSFCLIKQMPVDGYLHLSFYGQGSGQAFGGIYFGQGQWVLRHKRWSYRDSVSRADQPGNLESVSAAGPNQVLFNYLGNPVMPPANLDAAYTKEGLTQAMQAMAQAAGVSLVKLEIDDSEFPFLVGVVCAKPGDMEKLKAQIRAATVYNYAGGVGGNDRGTFNLIPHDIFPAEASQRIYHRMMLREAVFYDQVTGGNK